MPGEGCFLWTGALSRLYGNIYLFINLVLVDDIKWGVSSNMSFLCYIERTSCEVLNVSCMGATIEKSS